MAVYNMYTLIVPHSLKQKALSQAHEKSGHLGQKKTIKKAKELFYWCNLKVDVSNYVKQYITCQRFKGQTGLQQPFQVTFSRETTRENRN